MKVKVRYAGWNHERQVAYWRVAFEKLDDYDIEHIFGCFVQPQASEEAGRVIADLSLEYPTLITKVKTAFGGRLYADVDPDAEFAVRAFIGDNEIVDIYGVVEVKKVSSIDYESISGDSRVVARRGEDGTGKLEGQVTTCWLVHLPRGIIERVIENFIPRLTEY